MTTQEAKANIGEPFKLIGFTGLPFDTIISVDANGTIHGSFLEAAAEDCRLKGEQPEHLKKIKQHEQDTQESD